MSVKLRLQRKGRKKAPFYHIVAADARSPRDGRFIEKLGTYNPLTVPATIELNREKAYEWLIKGAQPTDTVRAILRFKGVLLQQHLAVGVKKGALTEEQAEAKLNAWIAEKETRINQRREATAEKHREHIAAVDGKPRVKAKPVVVVEEAPAPVAEEPASAVEAAVEVAAPVAEAVEAAAEVAAPVAEAVETAVEEAAPVVEAVETAVEEAAPAAEAVETAVEEAAPVAEAVETAVEEAAPVAEAVEEAAPVAEAVEAVVEEAAPVAEAVAEETTPAEEEKPEA